MEVTWWSSESELRKEQRSYLAQASVILARRRPTEKLPTNMYKHMPYAKNNLVAVLAISAVVFARPRLALHGVLGGQEVGATAERSEASLNAITRGLRTGSELESERYKELQRSLSRGREVNYAPTS